MSISITGFSITPINFTYGDVVSVAVTVRNTGSTFVSGLDYYILDSAGAASPILGRSGWGFNGKIPAGASKTFTQSVTINTEAARAIQSALLASGARYRTGFRLAAQTLRGNTVAIEEAVIDIGSKFYDEHRNPQVTAFSVQRCLADGTPDNEGDYGSLTAHFTLPEGFRCAVGYGHGSITREFELSGPVTNDTSALVNSGAIFLPQYKYDFMLALTDDVETLYASTVLPAAFANLHLSGHSTGGVAIGRFSGATLGNPKFECEYPASFYGGIEGVNRYATAAIKTGGTWVDGKPLYRRTYVVERPQNNAEIVTALPAYGVIRVVDAVANYTFDSEGSYWAGNYYSTANDFLRFYVNGQTIKIGFGSRLTVEKCWVTVEYTQS